MLAVVLHEHGGSEKLLETDMPDPQPVPGEVLVRVEAVALNHLDIWVREGIPGLKLEYPHILGSDIAGEVVGGGGGGEKVIVSPGLSCMRCRECLSGHDNLCRGYRILGESARGGYAQYLCVPVANLVPRPPHLSAVEAAAFPLTMLTAWQMLVRKARLVAGETVLLLGVGSGVGVA
ncbi:MAG: alcohol dehydrogenase catalytic domain-containing protein, partial [Pseudomonadota bacterium]